MDKKNLIVLIIILTIGLFIPKFIAPPKENKNFSNKNKKEIIKKEYSVSPKSFAGIIKEIRPSLVNIAAVHIVEVQSPFYRFFYNERGDNFFGGGDPEPETETFRQEATGSGFIVSPDGYVLTNYHVIKDASKLKVITSDNIHYDAEIVGKDPATDLAVVKIKSSKKFKALPLGNSDAVEVGDRVIAAGSPFGLNQTYTTGIISAQRQDLQVEGATYMNMFQTDAAINRGNSGGPLISLDGKVIGINTAIFAPTGVFSGIGFAVPVNVAKKILDDLIERGGVKRGWLGIEIIDINEPLKRQFKLKNSSGVLVNNVLKDSPSSNKLKRGDVIVAIDNVSISDSMDLREKIFNYHPGKKIKVEVIRDSEKINIEIELGERPTEKINYEKSEENSAVENKEKSVWKGVTVQNLTKKLKDNLKLKSTSGVIVVDVDETSFGYEIGLKRGDLIKGIDGQKVNNINDFKELSGNIDISKGVVFDIIRSGRPLYLTYGGSK